jgi:hypothetical protein
LPLPAPKPVDALRQHTRAVVLISADGEASPALLDSIRDSEIPCELIGHPVVAMAELVRLEKDNRQHSERTALVVADDERIEQLSSLFQAVRTRLPQVAIWVIAGDLAVQVQRAVVPEVVAAPAPAPRSASIPRVGPRAAPQLRIVEPSLDVEESTPAARERGDSVVESSTVEVKSTDRDGTPRVAAPANAHADPFAEDVSHSTKLTAEELDMLLGWDDQDAPERGPAGGGRR